MMKYEDVIFVYETSTEMPVIKRNIYKLILLNICGLLFGYALILILDLVVNKGMYVLSLLFIITYLLFSVIYLMLVIYLFFKKADMYILKLPGQILLIMLVCMTQFIIGKFFILELGWRYFIYLVIIQVSTIILFSILMFYLIKKKVYSLTSQSKLQNLMAISFVPGTLGFITLKIFKNYSDLIASYVILLLCSIIISSIPILIYSHIQFKTFSKEEILIARYKKKYNLMRQMYEYDKK